MKLPKLMLTDIDGVWTDGSFYYSEEGEALKRFHTYDGAGVTFLRANDIPTVVITAESSQFSVQRAKKLGVAEIFTGITNKVETALSLCKKYNITLDEVAYIGDDLGDYYLLQQVGISACPKNAPAYIKQEVDIVLSKNGGDGVFREFVEHILDRVGVLQSTLERVLNLENSAR